MGTSACADKQVAGDDEFRYLLAWYFWLYAAVSLSSVVLWTGVLVCEGVCELAVGGRDPEWRFLLMAAYWLVYGVTIVFFTLEWYLYSKQGWVRVSDAGLALRDWRCRERTVAWEDVRGLRVGELTSRPSLIIVTSHGRLRLRFSQYIDDPYHLVAAIVARASLTERKETWWGTVLSRPGS